MASAGSMPRTNTVAIADSILSSLLQIIGLFTVAVDITVVSIFCRSSICSFLVLVVLVPNYRCLVAFALLIILLLLLRQ